MHTSSEQSYRTRENAYALRTGHYPSECVVRMPAPGCGIAWRIGAAQAPNPAGTLDHGNQALPGMHILCQAATDVLLLVAGALPLRAQNSVKVFIPPHAAATSDALLEVAFSTHSELLHHTVGSWVFRLAGGNNPMRL